MRPLVFTLSVQPSIVAPTEVRLALSGAALDDDSYSRYQRKRSKLPYTRTSTASRGPNVACTPHPLWLPITRGSHQGSAQRQHQPISLRICLNNQLAAHGKSHALRVIASDDVVDCLGGVRAQLIGLTAPSQGPKEKNVKIGIAFPITRAQVRYVSCVPRNRRTR